MKIIEGLPPKKKYGWVSIDLELWHLKPKQLHRPFGELACMTICPDGKQVYIVRDSKQIQAAINRIASAEMWVFHNAGFDLRHLRRWAKIPYRKIWDTLLVERILWSGWYSDFGLEDLARRRLGIYVDKSVREAFYKKGGKESLTKEMLRYAAIDAIATWRAAQSQRPEFENDSKAAECYWKIDHEALWAVLEFRGVLLDVDLWNGIAVKNQKKADLIARQLGFNPGSPKQVLIALKANGLELLPDTNAKTLEAFKSNELVKSVLAHREADKRASTYGLSFVKNFVEKDGRIYPNFNPTGASTGRMACSDPNAQNIVAENEFRKCFVAGKGNVLVLADYAQHEPRVAAFLSGDQELISIFESGINVHLENARTIYKNPKLTKEKNPKEYKHGKSMNLAVFYGMTAYGLAEQTGFTVDEADAFLNEYFKRFWKLKRWIDRQRAEGRKTEWVRTLGGRRFGLNNYSRRSENNVINTPVQGSAADITKLAVIYFYREWKKSYPQIPFPVTLVVHDEIQAEVPRVLGAKTLALLKRCMLDAFQTIVPGVRGAVDIVIGKTWADKK